MISSKKVNPLLMTRALFMFRWGAMLTFLFGLILFTMVYMYTPGAGFGPTPLWSSAFSIATSRPGLNCSM